MIRYGLYVLAGGISITIVTRIDLIMIGSLLDLQQVAYYTIAFFIGNVIMVPAKSIAAISIPLIANAWQKNDIAQIQNIYSKSSINQLIIGGCLFLCIWLNIDEVFSFFPENFKSGKWVVFYIGISQLFNMVCGLNGEIIINTDYYRYDLFTSVFLVFVTIITNMLLIPEYGINGAGLATAISIFLFNVSRLIILKIKMNIHPFSLKTIFTIFLILVTYFFINYFLTDLGNVFLDIICKSLAVFIIFIPMLYAFNLSEDISQLLNELKNRFH
jgi:O-antigen/teichoic acid export membrane protein